MVGVTTKLNGLDVKARINTSTVILGMSGKGKFNKKLINVLYLDSIGLFQLNYH